jgi:uncharacterized membrane protein YdjX (TVP38/TMEM64 family)
MPALLFVIALGLNAVPSFVATTAVVIAFALRDDVGAVEAVLVGAAGAGCGRIVLALVARHGGNRFLRGAIRQNVDFVRTYAEQRRRVTLSLALLAAAPVNPAVAIFVTAGSLRLRLAPIVLAYTAGRAVFFGIAVATTGEAARAVSAALRDEISPLTLLGGLALTAAMVIALLRIDWQHLIERRRLRFVRSDR